MSAVQKTKLAEELLRRLAAGLRAVQLYAPTHPLVGRNITALADTLQLTLAAMPSIAVGIVGDIPVPRAGENMAKLIAQFQDAGIERIVFDSGVTSAELAELVQKIGGRDAREATKTLALQHIRVGRLQVEKGETSTVEKRDYRRLYNEAVSVAGRLWESAETEGTPDADAGRNVVDSLAEEVSRNRTALLALTALKSYDSYTFTHMVNVSILAMAQGRGLGIEGSLLREIGIGALMHDIGKVRTPSDILNKIEKLTADEFEILRRHPVDGAEILRRTRGMPRLAPIVAFEHHLRLDGTGYPFRVSRPILNIGTMLCAIADVYDAMRSQRVYQDSFPTDRILAVLQRNDNKQFDQHLVRRFVQLMGIYPAGNLVRLKSGEIAVVLKAYASDPYRPRVRLLFDTSGARLERPVELNLWEAGEGDPQSIEAPVDPAQYDIDPLSYL